ncbi:putative pyrimidine dimer DNA glycosylase/endonuclease V [Vibrio phage 150E35-1]|nr:putative pyrimidine dimer DNA glycosylase/endonuclease V [Vibrio phage 150E35-1]
MNIFALSECPIQSASYAADKHIVKMPLESVQLLSTAWRTAAGIDTPVIMPNGSTSWINLLEGEEYYIEVRYKCRCLLGDKYITWNDRMPYGVDPLVERAADIEKWYKEGYTEINFDVWKYQAQYVWDTKRALSATHANHPSNVWTRSGAAQYNWLMIHAYALEAEWKSRYGHSADRRHKSVQLLDNFPSGEDLFEVTEFTLPTPAMPDHYKVYDASGSIDVVKSYRTYYLYDKAEMGLPMNLWRPIRKGIVDAYVGTSQVA